MTAFKTTALSFVALGSLIAGSALMTPSFAAERHHKHWTINHQVRPTDLARDRATVPSQNESVERHYAAARARENAHTSGSVPGSTWATDNRAEATRRAIASNHG